MQKINKFKPWIHQLPFLVFILLLVVFPLAYTIYIFFHQYERLSLAEFSLCRRRKLC